MKRACIAAAFVALSALTGCGAAGRAAAMGVGFAVGAAAMSEQQQPEVRVVYMPPPGYMLVPAPEEDDGEIVIPEAPPKREPHGPQFQAAAARNLLDATTMDVCKDVAGMPAGWGHARVVFEPSGRVSAVLIDAPAGMSSEALSCVSARLSSVTVPEFAGAPMTVGTTWNAR